MANRKLFFYLYPALFVSILLPSLLDLGYWPLDTEVLLLTSVAVIIAVVLCFFAQKKAWVSQLFLAILVYWFIDAFFLRLTWFAVLLAALFFYLLRSKYQSNVVSMLITFFMVWITLALFQPNKPYLNQPLIVSPTEIESIKQKDLPLIVHLILDEQMSPALASSEIAQTYKTNHIVDDYVNHGFVFFSNAQSTSSKTQFSLSDLFSLGKTNDGKNVQEAKTDFTHIVLKNHYFDFLRKVGYKVVVVQSNFLRLCDNQKQIYCFSYSRAGNGHTMSRFSDRLSARLSSAILELHYRFYEKKTVASVGLYRALAKKVKEIFNLAPKQKSVFYSRPSTVLNVVEDIEQLLERPQRNTAYVFHLLLPHFPYVLDSTCQLNQDNLWAVPNRHNHVAVDNLEIYRAYWQQAQCMHQHVKKLIVQLERNPETQDAIIIVHGDHGARIARDNDSTNVAMPDDVQTFLAIKHGGKINVAVKVHEEPIVLQDFFSNTIQKILSP